MDHRHHCRWHWSESQRLKSEWSDGDIGSLARSLGRSVLAVYRQAHALGLHRAPPRGCESLKDAAARTGFTGRQLQRILRWAGYRPLRVSTREPSPRPRWAYVSTLEVDDAVDRWMRTETPADAGRRYGVRGSVVIRMLRQSDADPVAAPRLWGRASGRTKHRHYRLDPAVVDRVMGAAASSLESIEQAAARVGVDRHTLRGWLLSVGMGPSGRLWRLDPAEVDQVVGARKARPQCRVVKREDDRRRHARFGGVPRDNAAHMASADKVA